MLPTQELGQHSTSLLLELYRYPYAQPLHVSEEIHPIHVPNYPCAIQMLSNMLVTNACECFSTRNICRSTAWGVCITTRKYTWSEKKNAIIIQNHLFLPSVHIIAQSSSDHEYTYNSPPCCTVPWQRTCTATPYAAYDRRDSLASSPDSSHYYHCCLRSGPRVVA
jgi:hypothetical protein